MSDPADHVSPKRGRVRIRATRHGHLPALAAAFVANPADGAHALRLAKAVAQAVIANEGHPRHRPRARGKSVEALLGTYAPGLRRDLKDVIKPLVLADLGASPLPHTPLPQPWIRASEYARRIGMSLSELTTQLGDPAFRRAHGWPRPDGTNVYFNPDLLDLDRARALFASLPAIEPWPKWCHPASWRIAA